ncbi:hypothetical protein [Tranquillimonas rosea]|nr:hypothetical protein [Tranquillimonas rosea]
MSSEYRRKKPQIRRPNVDRSQGFGGHYEAQPKPASEPTKSEPKAAPEAQASQEPKTTEVPKAETPQAAATASDEKPAQEPQAKAPTPQPRQKPAAESPSPAAPSNVSRTRTRRQAKNKEPAPMKKVALTAYPKEDHRAALEAVQSEAVSIMDMVKLAGRRALAQFEPKAEFEAAPNVERMGSTHRYTTTKQVSQPVLEKLHESMNPLGLKSDNEMLRGQFEPLFWSELDAIIADVKKRKTK